MVGWGRAAVRATLLGAAVMSLGTSMAAAAVPTVGSDGLTASVFTYASAVRERVYIPQPGTPVHLERG